MEYRTLGNSDLNISRISFGCMSLKQDNPQNELILRTAVELGINYFDTADLYDKGENEKLIARALKPVRDNVIIATKVGNQWRPGGSGWDWNPRKEYILSCVEDSLRRLETDCIDVYQLHGGTIEDNTEESIQAFELLVQQGKIRYYGISSIRPNVIRRMVSRSRIISVMTQYSLLDRRPEESTLDLLQQNNIGVLTRGSVAQGLLVDKPAKAYLDHSEDEVESAATIIHRLSHERTPAQTALQYILDHPAITSAVVGIRTMEQLKEAASVFDVPLLTPAEIVELKTVIRPNFYKEHR
jgi:aryl-alcohol dehydrogenase-like predicted oxidoreductase